ncbi:MAG: GNAT family N-acetyltransferase [Microbacterium gubbeenense]|uniref:GNAT family N-acetyltransferase n=1 Tax=Microbacterium gubbeenense TaxID=159896 RepID=UPI003F96B006
MPETSEPPVSSAPLGQLDPVTLYGILRLRADVFVVEQECPYPDLDGRDLEDGALQLWIEEDGRVLATARLLSEGDDRRIGRVVTSRDARRSGYAAQVLAEAMRLAEGRAIRIDAQSHLEFWYARFGFVVTGPEFLEDGIPHVPMTRSAL